MMIKSNKHQWLWIDGAVYIYRSLSGKSVGENKYCAEMNAKTIEKLSQETESIPDLALWSRLPYTPQCFSDGESRALRKLETVQSYK
ncbi:hypothetical protein MJG53_001875 [Ovis ammon polii x Ovis aries]|uniref:Uncharacterized protein n=1 Tax=Ovis ammon polii x Ovis aries TaxID=2918886 RepID=A0ACB9VN08_9CETA|nr:hypothetical protein MJG53_001875 [Ovis ammon polii x Ovis aries]